MQALLSGNSNENKYAPNCEHCFCMVLKLFCHFTLLFRCAMSSYRFSRQKQGDGCRRKQNAQSGKICLYGRLQPGGTRRDHMYSFRGLVWKSTTLWRYIRTIGKKREHTLHFNHQIVPYKTGNSKTTGKDVYFRFLVKN